MITKAKIKKLERDFARLRGDLKPLPILHTLLRAGETEEKYQQRVSEARIKWESGELTDLQE